MKIKTGFVNEWRRKIKTDLTVLLNRSFIIMQSKSRHVLAFKTQFISVLQRIQHVYCASVNGKISYFRVCQMNAFKI